MNAHVSWWKRIPGRETATADVPDNSSEDETGSVDARHALNAALKTLTRREREVIVLRYVEDLSEEQTAAELGVAVGTVKSASSRGLTKLRRCTELAGYSMGNGG